jgi:hypothetical protein
MKRNFNLVLAVVCTIGSIAWLIEAFFFGRGSISQYIAPLIIMALLAGTWYRIGNSNKK